MATSTSRPTPLTSWPTHPRAVSLASNGRSSAKRMLSCPFAYPHICICMHSHNRLLSKNGPPLELTVPTVLLLAPFHTAMVFPSPFYLLSFSFTFFWASQVLRSISHLPRAAFPSLVPSGTIDRYQPLVFHILTRETRWFNLSCFLMYRRPVHT